MGKRFEEYKLIAAARRLAAFRREFVEKLVMLSEEDAAKELEKMRSLARDVDATEVFPLLVKCYNEARKRREQKT